MVKSAVADESLFSYVTDTAKQSEFCIGLILGQSCAGKDYVVHFAKTIPIQIEEGEKEEWKSLSEVNENCVAEHAKQAIRMLPGGINVLGIFVTSADDLLNPFNAKIKGILQNTHKLLDSNKFLHGNRDPEKLIINYSTRTNKYSSKAYDIERTMVQPADFKISKPSKWNYVEFYLEVNEHRYFQKEEQDWPLENHFNAILKDINDGLESSVYIFDNEYRSNGDTIESVGKKKIKNTRGKGDQQVEEMSIPIKVLILQSKNISSIKNADLHKTMETFGHISIEGRIASKVWLQQKMTVKEASTAIRQDIMRSLAARFEMHFDSLIEEEYSKESSVHEPPRRVFITVPSSEIQFSDYLFPGEGADNVKQSLSELLSIADTGKLAIHNAEGEADMEQYAKPEAKLSFQSSEQEEDKYLIKYLIVAIIVIVLSLILRFYCI